jgi:uncharacterized membrane protein YdjX (TVP38/TMEM64 family)
MTPTGMRALVPLAVLIAGGLWLRAHLGLTSVDAVRAAVDTLGWRAPAAFLALVMLRQFVLLPSVLLLTAGGIIFGGALGTLLGGTGIIVSGIANFLLARRFGAAFVPPWLQEHLARVTARGSAPVVLFTGLATVHPVGPLIAAQWAAGCSTVAVSTFLLVVVPASYARAAALATFGSTLGELGSPASLLLAGVLAAVVVVPLCFPGVRRRLFTPPDVE